MTGPRYGAVKKAVNMEECPLVFEVKMEGDKPYKVIGRGKDEPFRTFAYVGTNNTVENIKNNMLVEMSKQYAINYKILRKGESNV